MSRMVMVEKRPRAEEKVEAWLDTGALGVTRPLQEREKRDPIRTSQTGAEQP